MTKYLTDRRLALQNLISRLCGRPVEITIRGGADFTFSFVGDDPTAVQRIKSYFDGYTVSCLSEYDKECDLSCVYATFDTEAISTPARPQPEKIVAFPAV